jgi:putative colanic acid biosynthesis UDP-glucose lipid carrier transferase
MRTLAPLRRLFRGLVLARRRSAPRRIVLAGPDECTLPVQARLAAGGNAHITVQPVDEMVRWLNRHETLDGLVEEIIVVGPMPTEAQRSALILALHGHPVELRYGVDPGDLLADAWGDGRLGQLTVRFQPWRQRVVKRAEDLVLTILALPLLLPAMAMIGLMVRWDGPGPIFFRQRRLGRGGKAFTILKFRTMATAASGEVEAPQARAGDSRITAVGHFLRRSGLDELPQVFNVLKGEMSLVGPRPHAFPHDLLWSERVSGYTRRFEMKPGITGLAQMRGHHGFVEDEGTIRDRLKLDMDYIGSWSLLLDLRILAATLWMAARRVR